VRPSLYKKLSDLVDKKEKRSKKRWRKMFGWSFEDMLGQTLTLMDPLTHLGQYNRDHGQSQEVKPQQGN
jgi:hypothetical protein